MNIKQEYKEAGIEHVKFNFIGEYEGVSFDGSRVVFQRNGKQVFFFISEIEELIPYFQRWAKE